MPRIEFNSSTPGNRCAIGVDGSCGVFIQEWKATPDMPDPEDDNLVVDKDNISVSGLAVEDAIEFIVSHGANEKQVAGARLLLDAGFRSTRFYTPPSYGEPQ